MRHDEKVQLLTLLPASWTIEKTRAEMGVTDHVVNPSSLRWLILYTTAIVFAIIFSFFNQVPSHYMTVTNLIYITNTYFRNFLLTRHSGNTFLNAATYPVAYTIYRAFATFDRENELVNDGVSK